jgi:hypothetical protein
VSSYSFRRLRVRRVHHEGHRRVFLRAVLNHTSGHRESEKSVKVRPAVGTFQTGSHDGCSPQAQIE